MALKSTVFKAELQIADMDRNYYGSHFLTIARHPSETDERMMVRLLAFAINASDSLGFGRGISTDDEADLWQKDLTGAITLWIDVGMPDEKLIKKACNRATAVRIYAYGRAAPIWWNQQKLDRLENLSVFSISPESGALLAKLAARSMQLNCTIQEGQIWLADDSQSVEVALCRLKG